MLLITLTSYAACLTLLLISPAQAQHGADEAQTMGPVAFMWPPDREWGAAQDNTAPCGSAAGVRNRTQFPLLNGQVALVGQNESWSIQLAISHLNNPTSNNDFQVIISDTRIPELAEGHQCYPVSDPARDVEAGSNATFQIQYTSDWENDGIKETYYACADITYVPMSQFKYQVPCFNATSDDFNITEPSSTPTSTAISSSETSSAGSSRSKGLSGGAIAGIVVGVVIGLGLVVGAALLFWRKQQQQKRLRAQESSVRNVKWTDGQSSRSATENDVPLDTLRK